MDIFLAFLNPFGVCITDLILFNNLLSKFDIEFEPDRLHDAVYDVKMTLQIFHKLIWNVEV